MNNYDLSWRQSAKLRMINLPMLYRKEAKTYAVRILVVTCACLYLMSDAANARADRANELAELRANQVGQCVMGELRFIETSDDGSQRAIISKKAEEFAL